MEKWFVTMKKADFNGIAAKYHISPILARLIRNRDVKEDAQISSYLNGTAADLGRGDPEREDPGACAGPGDRRL